MSSAGRQAAPTTGRAEKASLLQLLAWAFVVFMATRPFDMQLGGVDPGGAQSQVTKPVSDYIHYVLTVGVLGYMGVQGKIPAMIEGLLKAPLFLAFFVLALASAAWSGDSAYSTVRQAFSFVGTMIFFSAMQVMLNEEDSARGLLYAFFMAVVLSVVWALVFPHYGKHNPNDIYQAAHHGKWRGVYAHKNALGQVCGIAVGSMVSYGGRLVRWPVRVIVIGLGLICLAFAQSASGVLIAGVGAGFGFILFKLKGATRWVAAAGATVVCALLAGLGSELLSSILIAVGKTPTLSGRTYMWEAAADLISEKWLLGYGLAAVRDADVTGAFSKIGGEVLDANNAYLELTIAVGLGGTLLMLAAIADAITRGLSARLISEPRLDARRMMIQVIIMCMFAAVAESSPLMPDGTVNAFLIFALLWLSTAGTSGVQSTLSHPAVVAEERARRQSKKRGSHVIVDLD